jgi:hypothetical protein
MTKRAKHPRPSVGSTFHHVYFGTKYSMEVISVDGSLGYKVGKNVFRTPTAAAKSITEAEVNGWKFWGMNR